MAIMSPFHLPSSGASPVSPAFRSTWEQTGEADRVRMPLKRFEDYSTPLTDKTITVPITTTQDILCRQYISDPLPPFALPRPAVYGPVKISQSDALINSFMTSALYIVSSDGSIVRGGLWAASDTSLIQEGTETAVAAETRNFAQSTSRTYSTQAGDRIVYEVGVRVTAPAVAGSVTFRFGNPSGVADFANAEGLTTDLCPWVAFDFDVLSHTSLRPNPGFRPGAFKPG